LRGSPEQLKEPTVNEDIVIVPIISGLLGFVTWITLSTIRRYKTAKAAGRSADQTTRKFGSGQELLAYVQSDAGKQFLDSLTMEQGTPYGRILGATQVGIILVLLGLVLLFLRGRVAGAEEGFLVSGTLALSLGIGFGLSAALSYFLSKSFGLLRETIAHR
jgi:hypothetical protein